MAAIINSSFTFYWDVAKDWDLCLFSDVARFLQDQQQRFRQQRQQQPQQQPHSLRLPNSQESYPDRPFGLRKNRYFYADGMYYTAITVDLVLRFTWLSRLTTRLNWVNDLESGVFVLMFLEVVRRWIWIFFRVETEWGELHHYLYCHCLITIIIINTDLLRTTIVRSTRGPAPDDILLGEFSTKIDED